MNDVVEAGLRIGEALRRVLHMLWTHREPTPDETFTPTPIASVESNPLEGKTIEELLHPDVWVDGFTVTEMAKLTKRRPEEFESEVRALVNRGVIRVALPSGGLFRNEPVARPDMFNIPTRSGGYKGLV